MQNNFNILITSISKKVPLIKAVRHSLAALEIQGKIFGGDSNSKCVGRYFVDDFWQMPLQNMISIEELILYCKKQGIKAIIPTRDGELSFFAQHRELLHKNQIACLVSPLKTITSCYDKLLFCQQLSSYKFPVIPTSTDIKSLNCHSYVVKERFGSGSNAIGLHLNALEAKAWGAHLKHPIYQPFIEGKEYSVDLYIDQQGQPQGAIARVRELVIDGESQITTSIRYPELEALCLKAATRLGIYGHAVCQVISDVSHHFHLIECNARFGGASTLSVTLGLKSFEWFIQESLKQALPPFNRSLQEARQIRFAEDQVTLL